jgi:hypothetical protein
MFDVDRWFDRPIDHRAPVGGMRGVNGRFYRGGEFEPFYVPRPVMPQIEEADYAELFRFATAQGIFLTLCTRHPDTLKFHQRVKFAHGFTPDASVEDKPILVSADGYVLDGNHRLAMHKREGKPVNCIQLNLEFEEAIAFLFSFPKVGTTNA